MTTDTDNYKLALRLQKEGKYREALETVRSISNPILRAGILIDSGADARKPAIIREGVRLFEDALTQDHGKISRASLLYNIANGYSAIFQSRLANGAKLVAPNDDDLRKAKRYYQEALAEMKGNPPSLRTQIFVNFGNCLSMLGRTFEAMEAFSAAVNLEPQNGMAAGNLGIALDRVSDITGRYLHHYLLEAHQAITTALSSESHLSYGGLDAAIGFREKLNELQEIIDAHEHKPKPLKKVSLSNPKTTRDRYILFCLKHKLFLNAWAGDPYVMPAISDEIEYGSLTVKLSEVQTVSELLRTLNEVKEAYSTARYLFYLSQSGSGVRDNISSLTSYHTTDGDELNGLQLGLCKSAYTRAFDVLDKVARIINVYFKIGKTRDYFWDVLVEKQSRGQTHEIRFVARPKYNHGSFLG
jgi:tetratricopeptide (TPR) repeat protein